MARTVGDVAILFEALSGRDSRDPVSAPVSSCKPGVRDLRRLTVGYFEDDGLVPVTEETRSALQDAVRVLKDAGFRVEPFRPRTLERLRNLWWKFFVQCGAMFYQPTIRGKEEMLSPIFREFLQIAKDSGELTASELLDAWAELDLLRGETLQEMEKYPILLCPVASIPAFRHGERSWTIDGHRVEYLDAVRHTQWFNVLAAPAVVMPVGQSPERLPIGVQVVARPYEDETALAVAAIVDDAFGFRVPPLAANSSSRD